MVFWVSSYSFAKQLQYVCLRHFSITVTDALCNTFSSLDTRVWIDSTHCEQSQECFSTQCINYPSSSKGITSGPCANHSLDLFINCSENYIIIITLCQSSISSFPLMSHLCNFIHSLNCSDLNWIILSP